MPVYRHRCIIMAAPPVNESIRERIVNSVNRKLGRFIVNTVWGHIIYKPVHRGKWKAPFGMSTLNQFIEFHESRFNITQKRTDHPIALEIYYSITLTRELTDREVAMVTAALAEELVDEFFVNIIDIMEWGFTPVNSPFHIPVESKKRVSHNGEDFTEEDIANKRSISHLETRFR